MGVYVHDRNWGSRRSIAFVAIIIFHVILIYGLKSGFAQKVMESIAPPIVTTGSRVKGATTPITMAK